VFRAGSRGSTRTIWLYQHWPWQMFISGMEPGTGLFGILVAFTPLATQVCPPSAERNMSFSAPSVTVLEYA
jgi:hypothetical protein